MATTRAVLLTVTAALCLTAQTKPSTPSSFSHKLPRDQQIVHALNRLTFGPKPGDADEVRRIGLEKWIALQLHPERITESLALTQALGPLESLRADVETIFKTYPLQPPTVRLAVFKAPTEILTPDEMRRVYNGTAEERLATLDTLDPAKRRQLMTVLPPQLLTPALQKEQTAARQAQQQETAKAIRELMPPLADLLSGDQLRIATRGTREEVTMLLASLDPDKRQKVAAAMPQGQLAAMPALRRAGVMLRSPQQVLTDDLRQGKVFRALYSSKQLEEVLVDFWFNHFNVFEGKQSVRPVLADYERNAIRPHVLGHFKDLLLATAQHPAMLYYLDNWESLAPGAFEIGPFAGPPNQMAQQMQRQARGLNENYGRELMELHTLGVDGGYTQQDVIDVARCFTGWTIRQPNTKPEFVFAGFMHDSGEKTILGHKIAAGGGIEDGMQVIDILARHPATARFISRQLAQRFVADDPPQALVNRMAATFTKTNGDLRAVLELMFASPEFLSEAAWQAKVKSPLEMMVSAARALDSTVVDTNTLVQLISSLGEPLYGKVEPTGFPNTTDAWLNTANLMGRMNFAVQLASARIAGITPKLPEGTDAAAIARQLLSREPTPELLAALREGLARRDPKSPQGNPQLVSGLVLGSPDFQKR